MPSGTDGSTDPTEIENRLALTGALKEGHFLLSSGLHSPRYVQCARLLMHPEQAEWAGRELARHIDCPVDVVVGPALGGVIMAHELARALGVRALFAERVEDCFALRRGFELEPGERVIVVEDVVTTGGSAAEVARLVHGLGAEVVRVATLVDRSKGQARLPAPLVALARLEFPTYEPGECPLCAGGSVAEKPGSRKRTLVESGPSAVERS
jgi:orotate phosphoribosyltransferase